MPCSVLSQSRRSASAFGPDFFTRATHSSRVRPVFFSLLATTARSYSMLGCGLYSDAAASLRAMDRLLSADGASAESAWSSRIPFFRPFGQSQLRNGDTARLRPANHRGVRAKLLPGGQFHA